MRSVNPQVVGSSPTGGAKENHRFSNENGGFSYFLCNFEKAHFLILGQFWANGSENVYFGPPSEITRTDFLCLFPE